MSLHNNNYDDDLEEIAIRFLIDELDDDMDDEIFEMLIKQQRQALTLTRQHIFRDRVEANNRLFSDYFADNPLYPPQMFRRRFRMQKDLFLRIVQALSNHSEYFKLRYDAWNKTGHMPIQKCTAAIRQLAYGCPPDTCDDYIKIGATTARECLIFFCNGIVEIFGPYYLRRPTTADVDRLLEMHNRQHGFPGMLGSLDCMHWQWRACPVAWHGQFTRGDQGVPTIMLEAVASYDLWIWHAFFGVAGANNDINVLRQSSLFNDVVQGYAPEVRFTVNQTEYTKGYYLVDGIYPEWATFVKSFPSPLDPKRKLFKKMQEAARKDVERAFGVLQARWAIVRNAARFWDRGSLKNIMCACIIMHNMIVENKGDQVLNFIPDMDESPSITYNQGSFEDFRSALERRAEVRDRETHHQLRADLVEHIWQRFGGQVQIN